MFYFTWRTGLNCTKYDILGKLIKKVSFLVLFYRNFKFGISRGFGQKTCTILMDMNGDIIQVWTFIYVLWNVLGCSKFVRWYIIIFLIHLVNRRCLISLTVIFKVTEIGCNVFSAALEKLYFMVIYRRFCPRICYFLSWYGMDTDRRFPKWKYLKTVKLIRKSLCWQFPLFYPLISTTNTKLQDLEGQGQDHYPLLILEKTI